MEKTVHGDDTALRLFHDSLERANRDPTFYARFYRYFIASSDEIAGIFAHRDIVHIQQKLKMTLEMVADDADGEPGVDMYLRTLGNLHARLNVTSEMFGRWRDSLIRTVAEFDPLFDDAVERAWAQVIDRVIAKIGARDEEA